MFRIFSLPLIITALLALPVMAHAAARDANMPLWQSIVDYEEKHAFENYGPPMRENTDKFAREQRLYEDMVQNFDDTAEDEPDFTFIVEAYSVAIDVFRPAVIRPEGQAIKQDDDNPFGEDDPLPESVKSTSAYVEEVRPTFMPGKPLKMRPPEEIKLGNEQLGSLFADTDKLKKEAAVVPKEIAPPEVMGPPMPPEVDHPPAGVIDQPKKKPVPEGPAPGSDEETLVNLQKAVKELGLEKQLNFDGSKQSIGSMGDSFDATPAPGTVGPPVRPVPPVLGPPMPATPKTALPRAPVKKPAAKKTETKKTETKKPEAKKPAAKPPVAAPPKKAPAPPPAPVQNKPAPPKKELDQVKKLKRLSPEELAKIQAEDKPDIESSAPASPRARR